jgi:hypothetical protein
MTGLFGLTGEHGRGLRRPLPTVRITGQRRPDRGTIGGSSANRDYRMSTYVNALQP